MDRLGSAPTGTHPAGKTLETAFETVQQADSGAIF